MELEQYWGSTRTAMGYTDVGVRISVNILDPLYVVPGPTIL